MFTVAATFRGREFTREVTLPPEAAFPHYIDLNLGAVDKFNPELVPKEPEAPQALHLARKSHPAGAPITPIGVKIARIALMTPATRSSRGPFRPSTSHNPVSGEFA